MYIRKYTYNYISENKKLHRTENWYHCWTRKIVANKKPFCDFAGKTPEDATCAGAWARLAAFGFFRWRVTARGAVSDDRTSGSGLSAALLYSLKQHNGELKGGAKASRAGRPWVCACLIQGFMDKSKACAFESKWKICSRKLPRKENLQRQDQHIESDPLPLLRHRHTALDRVKGLIDCSHLEIVWKHDLS